QTLREDTKARVFAQGSLEALCHLRLCGDAISHVKAHFLPTRSGENSGEDDENNRGQEECQGQRAAIADHAECHDAKHGKDQGATSASRVRLTKRLSRPGSRKRISRVSIPALLRAIDS